MHDPTSPRQQVLAFIFLALAAVSAAAQDATATATDKPTVDVRASGPPRMWYPPQARRKKIEGQVLVGFSLDATGMPRDVAAVSTDHPEELEAAAVGIVKGLKFRLPAAWEEGSTTLYKIRIRFDICPFDGPSSGPLDVEEVTITACPKR